MRLPTLAMQLLESPIHSHNHLTNLILKFQNLNLVLYVLRFSQINYTLLYLETPNKFKVRLCLSRLFLDPLLDKFSSFAIARLESFIHSLYPALEFAMQY